MDDKIYRKIVGRMEAGKIPVYPGIIRKKAIVRYKSEKEAELKRKQEEYKRKIETERKKRAKEEAERRQRWYKRQEVVKTARAGHWVRINLDGSISGAGEAAFSPSQAKAMGYKWGTTTTKNDKTVFVPLPKEPSGAEYLGILQWKVREGHYKRPEVQKQIKQEIEIGGKKYGITAPAWAGGYMKQYSAAAREIRDAYQKAVKSQKTPSGYELKEITLAKEGKGLRFGYVTKPPLRKPLSEPILSPTKKIPGKQVIQKRDEPKYKEVPKGFVRPTPYAPKKGMPTVLLQTKKLRHPAYMMGTVTAIPEVHKPGLVSTFLGIPARKQKKVVEKELKDVLTIESEYKKKGWIKPVLPTIKPEDIGKIEIVGEYKDRGFARPTPQLEMQFVGSPEYRSQLEKVKKIDVGIKPYIKEGVYTSPGVTKFEEKWKPYTKGEFFSGTEEQHVQYLKESDIVSKNQKADIAVFHTEIDALKGLEGKRDERYKALTKEYGEYDVAQKEYKRLHGLGLVGKYEIKEKELGKRFSPLVSFVRETRAYAETPEVKKVSEKGYGEYRKLFGLPPKPFEWERKVGEIESEHKMGIVEGVGEKPLKTAITTAAFFGLPSVLKGVRIAAKPAVVAGTKVFPRAMPWAAKWTPRAVGVGLGGMYGYSIEERIRAAPPEKRVREFGKITGTELLPMSVGTYAGMKAIPSIVKGAEVTPEGAIRTYKGLGLGEYKHPVVGMFRETIKTPDVAITQKALIFGEKYPALRVGRIMKKGELITPEWRVPFKVGKVELGLGRSIKFERVGGEAWFAKHVKALIGKEPIIPTKAKVSVPKPELPPPKPVIWTRKGPTDIAKRVTALVKTRQPRSIKQWGMRIEKPEIPTWTEIVPERLFHIKKGYTAFELGREPTIVKRIGLAKPKYQKSGIEEMIHPFRKKVPHTYEPSVLDYQRPKGLLGEGFKLDIYGAKIRPTERPLSPIEKLYEKPTVRDIYGELGIKKKPFFGVKEALKPIETRFLKFTKDGELISQPEIGVPKPKQKVATITKPIRDIKMKIGVSVLEEPKVVGIKEQWEIPIGEGIPSWRGWIPKKGIKRKVDVWGRIEGKEVVKPIIGFKLDLSKPQKPYRKKTIQEKEAEIRAKIESGEYIAHKDAKGMITLQKVITKQKVKPIVKEVTTVAEKAQKDLSRLISGEKPKYKVRPKTIFEQFKEIRTKAPQIGTMVRPMIKPQPKHRVFPAFFPTYDYKEKVEAKISEKYKHEPLTLLGQRYKPFQPVAFKHDIKPKEKTRLAFVPFAGQAYKHEPIVEQKTMPVEKFAFKEMNILDRIFEKPPVPPIITRQPFKLLTPPYIKPKKDKKLKLRRKPFGAYQLDVTNPILSPVELLRMMGGLK